MKLLSSIKTTPWLSVAALLLAGLMGWLIAWIIIPVDTRSAATADKAATLPTSATTSSTPAAPPIALGTTERAEAVSPSQTLEKLVQKQASISESGRATAPILPQPPPTGTPGASRAENGKPVPADAREAERARKMKAMRELQTRTLAEIQAVPPGDTKGLIAAMVRFDAQMQAAGAPAIMDMEKLRKTLDGVEQIQQKNRELIAEAEKGRAADPVKVKALSQEIQQMQQALPRQFIKTDVLQKQMTP
jgi:hypothetical protein